MTISGTVTFNLWMSESNMSANVGAQCVVERLDSTGAIVSTIANSEKGTELPVTTAAAQNWTATPTSTNMLKGDRIRIRVAGNDGGGTMATGFTFDFAYNGSSAAANGDSYVTFTETFGFLTTDPGVDAAQLTSSLASDVGATAATTRRAQRFVSWNGTATTIDAWVQKTGSPTDDLVLELQTESAGLPSNTVLATASVAGTSLTTSLVQTTFNIADTALTAWTPYWVVLKRSGAIDIANNYQWGVATSGYDQPTALYGGASWALASNFARFRVNVSPATTTIYPVTTDSAVDPDGLGPNSNEIWTTRGGSATTGSRAAVTGWTSPLLIQVASVDVEWFTKPLTAFTLSGPVLANIRFHETVATNVSVRAELAVCNSSGASAVVWGGTSHPTALTTTQTDYTLYLAGDDVAITDGQRLRFKVFIDDSSTTAMATGGNGTLTFNGPTGGASGDTYLIFGQTLTEYVATSALPILVMAPRR